MNPENDPFAIRLRKLCIEGQDLKYCDIYAYYIAIARVLGRIRPKVPRGIEIPGFIPPVNGPDPAPEILPGRLYEYLFDGDPDPIPALNAPIMDIRLAKGRIGESLNQAKHLRDGLTAALRQLETDISQLEKSAP